MAIGGMGRVMLKSSTSLRLILPLGLGMIISFASSYYLLGVMAEPMAAATGATINQLFAALSVAFLIAALCSLIAGRWTDRRGGREVLVAASVMLAGALGLMGMATGPVTALIGVAALGFGMGIGFYGPANALLVGIYGSEARRPITAVSLIGACGGAIGWPLSLWLMQSVGWRGACWVWAGAHLLICVPLYLALLPRGGGTASSAPKDRVQWDRPMVQLALLFAGAWWVATACAAQMPRVMMALGLDAAEAAVAAGTMALAAIGMRLCLLVVPLKTSPILMLRWACLLHPVGVVLALIGGRVWAVAVPLGQGAGNGLLSVAAGVVPLYVFGKANYGRRQALILLPARFVQAIAPLSFGLALDQSVGLALGLSGCVCLVMFRLTWGFGSQRAKAPVVLEPDRA